MGEQTPCESPIQPHPECLRLFISGTHRMERIETCLTTIKADTEAVRAIMQVSHAAAVVGKFVWPIVRYTTLGVLWVAGIWSLLQIWITGRAPVWLHSLAETIRMFK